MEVGIGKCGDNKIRNKIPMGAILHYEGAADELPTSTGETLLDHCDDETGLVPFVPNTVPSNIMAQQPLDLTGASNADTENLFRWFLDGSTFRTNWSQPTLKTNLENGPSYGASNNVYNITTKNDVSTKQSRNMP